MSSKLPFEDAFKNKMNDLPTGDEDAAWQKMKRLLEEKDKRKSFAWINIYTVCTCILIAAGICIWMILPNYDNIQKNIAKAEKSQSNKEIIIKTEKQKAKQLLPATQPGATSETSNQKNSIDTLSRADNVLVNTSKQELRSINILNRKKQYFKQHLYKQHQTGNNKLFKANTNQVKAYHNDSMSTVANNLMQSASDSLRNLNRIQHNKITQGNTDTLNFADNSRQQTSLYSTKSDSLKAQTDAANNLKNFTGIDTAVNKKQTKIVLTKQKQYFIAAGVQLKQQIPLSGQKIIAYNYNGNKALLTDYVPSAFIKFEKNKRWFLQAEFHYASPHFVKQLAYSRQTKADYTSGTVTTVTAHLQKTYYNELPLTFNYYIQPRWSIGAGAAVSWFRGAVAEQETKINNIKGGTDSMATQINPFKRYTDSFLYKTNTSLLLQTGYTVNRWSFTLRYEHNLQPFIKYTLPDGMTDSKKNTSLELLIGYRFFKSPLFRFKNK